MSKIVLLAESGSDLPPSLAHAQGIYLVPMHVTMGGQTLDDGTFPPEEICHYYDQTGKLPKTSGCAPEDFTQIFEKIRSEHPDCQILHLAYSAVTTVSYQSARIAAQELDYVTSIDTQHVSAGQGLILLEMARYLREYPAATMEQAVAKAEALSRKTRMCFVPDDLEYLRAGGRVSNVVALGGRLLSLHPCIEILDGRLLAKKKYRGKLEKVVPALIREYTQRENLDKRQITFVYSAGLPDTVRFKAELTAKLCGFGKIDWIKTGCVITTHGGPSCFGIAGFAQE